MPLKVILAFNVVIFQTERLYCYLIGLIRMDDTRHDYLWLDGKKFKGFKDLIQFNVFAADRNHDCVCVQKKTRQRAIEAKSVHCLEPRRSICQETGSLTVNIFTQNFAMLLMTILNIIAS